MEKNKEHQGIMEKLDKILAILTIREISDQDRKISILKYAGFGSEEIGLIMGHSNVRTTKGWKGK